MATIAQPFPDSPFHVARSGFRWLATLVLSLWLLAPQAHAQPVDVALAGFAFSGSHDTLDQRFPYSRRYEADRKAAGAPLGPALYQMLSGMPQDSVRIVPQIDQLKGKSQALAVALVVGSETVSVEELAGVYKIFVLIRGQTMFFDFKSMNVVRAYPISFAYVDVSPYPLSPSEIQERVAMVYEGASGKPGLLSRFASSVASATIPSQVSRYLQVTSAQISPEAQAFLPPSLRSDPATAETWAADLVSEAISTRTGVPLVPFTKGYAIGNAMSMRVSDGTVWQLKLPKPDYEINVALTNFKKVKFSEVPGGGTSYVYGAYGQIQIEEPMTKKVFLNTALKNGETRVIPASQSYVDDAPHYYDAVNGMFIKLAQTIDGKGDGKWIRNAASAKDIDNQVLMTSELIKLCK